jgi:hypothetical protein
MRCLAFAAAALLSLHSRGKHMNLQALGSALVTSLSICGMGVGLTGGGVIEVPGWITDSAGKVLYLTGEKVGVVAVDAEDGRLLWEYADATRPLVLVDHRLAVLANEPGRPNVLRVRFLDVEKKGARAGESDPLIFPKWVDFGGGRSGGLVLRFELRASLVGGELHLHWTAARSYVGGTLYCGPQREAREPQRQSATGLAVVDPRSGGVTMRSLSAEDEAPAADWGTRVDELPQPVKELARREGWFFARLVGARAYGQVRQSEPRDGVPVHFAGGRVVHVIQAVDIATGKLLWQRPIGEELPHALPQ